MQSSRLIEDSIGWDVENWSRCLAYWETHTALAGESLRALEVGSDSVNGGISLWLAANGFDVTCSGLHPPTSEMQLIHEQHGLTDSIRYEQIDVLNIPHESAFDLVVFKSLLGFFGMVHGDTRSLQRRAIAQAHSALKPGGELWFAENAAGSKMHELLRGRFGWAAKGWECVIADEIDEVLLPFSRVESTTLGVLAVFGRSEKQRRVLARFDRRLGERLAPPRWRYIVTGVAKKDAPVREARPSSPSGRLWRPP